MKKLVVLSDKYLPNNAGGAEVSLHQTLKSLINEYDISVITFNHIDNSDLYKPNYELDGIKVFYIGSRQNLFQWPPRKETSKSYQTLNLIEKLNIPFEYLKNDILKSINNLIYESSSRNLSTLNRFSALKTKYLASKIEPNLYSGIDYEKIESEVETLNNLINLVDYLSPDYYHADNLLSMISSSIANIKQVKSIKMTSATVRDHRFSCLHGEGKMNINGVECKSCVKLNNIDDSIPCVNIDNKKLEREIKKNMLFNQEIKLFTLRYFDKVTTTSYNIADSLSSKSYFDKSIIIPNPVDEKVRKTSFHKRKGILFIGMMNDNKGVKIALDIFKVYKERYKDSEELTFIGNMSGSFKDEIEKYDNFKYVSNYVSFKSKIDKEHLNEIMSSAKCVILPTKWPEPFGRLPLEAALNHTPVVAFDKGGFKETIINNETGFLVYNLDLDDFASKIYLLVNSESEHKRITKNAYKHITYNYNTDKIANLFKEKVWN